MEGWNDVHCEVCKTKIDYSGRVHGNVIYCALCYSKITGKENNYDPKRRKNIRCDKCWEDARDLTQRHGYCDDKLSHYYDYIQKRHLR